jgi:hypothetical protein
MRKRARLEDGESDASSKFLEPLQSVCGMFQEAKSSSTRESLLSFKVINSSLIITASNLDQVWRAKLGQYLVPHQPSYFNICPGLAEWQEHRQKSGMENADWTTLISLFRKCIEEKAFLLESGCERGGVISSLVLEITYALDSSYGDFSCKAGLVTRNLFELCQLFNFFTYGYCVCPSIFTFIPNKMKML